MTLQRRVLTEQALEFAAADAPGQYGSQRLRTHLMDRSWRQAQHVPLEAQTDGRLPAISQQMGQSCGTLLQNEDMGAGIALAVQALARGEGHIVAGDRDIGERKGTRCGASGARRHSIRTGPGGVRAPDAARNER